MWVESIEYLSSQFKYSVFDAIDDCETTLLKICERESDVMSRSGATSDKICEITSEHGSLHVCDIQIDLLTLVPLGI